MNNTEQHTKNSSNIIRLEKLGLALFGRSWRSQMVEALGVDHRRITHWLKGTRPIPDSLWPGLQDIAKKRISVLQDAIEGLINNRK